MKEQGSLTWSWSSSATSLQCEGREEWRWEVGGGRWEARACDDQQIRNSDTTAREECARGVVLDSRQMPFKILWQRGMSHDETRWRWRECHA
jgi:hypothetical protein